MRCWSRIRMAVFLSQKILRYARTAASIGAGLLLSLGLFAIIVQITDVYDYRIMHIDPVSGLPVYYKNSSFFVLAGCYENTVETNNIGFHGLDVTPQKADDAFRIVIIGSSYIEARQIPVEAMYSTLLQHKLNADPNRKYTYEVIPIGVNGNSAFLNALYYVWYGSILEPDLVINFETQFEISHDYPEPEIDEEGRAILQVPQKTEDPVKARIRDEIRRFKLLVNLYNRYLVFRDAVAEFWAHPLFFTVPLIPAEDAATITDEFNARWKSEEAVIKALSEHIREDGARLVLASWYGPGDTWKISAQELSSRFAGIAQRHAAAHVDLTPTMSDLQSAAGKPATWFPCDGHWTPAGNEYAAEALYRFLAAHPALLRQ